jgi:hypothetical protein
MIFINQIQNHDIDELIDNGWDWTHLIIWMEWHSWVKKGLSFAMLNWIYILNNIYVVDFIHKYNFI